MQHTSIPFTLTFDPQGCMAEAAKSTFSRVDYPQFIPQNITQSQYYSFCIGVFHIRISSYFSMEMLISPLFLH